MKTWQKVVLMVGGTWLAGRLMQSVFGEEADLDDRLLEMQLDAIERVESGGNANAVSPAGARGAYQFMPATWADVWTRILKEPQYADFKYAFDRALSRRAAKAYLAWIKRYLSSKNLYTPRALYEDANGYGYEDYAFAAYNAGVGAVVKAGGVPAFKETRDYVAKVRAAIR